MKKIFLLGFLMLYLLTFTVISADVPSMDNESAGGNNCNYIFIIHAKDYNSKLGDTVEYIFNKMLKPGDQLSIISPKKPYSYSKKTRETQTKEKLIELTKNVLKRDITIDASDYNQMLENMNQLVIQIHDSAGAPSGDQAAGRSRTLSSSVIILIRNYMVNYRQLWKNILNLRKLNEDLFLKLAASFKNQKGKNYIYILYQKELRPIPKRDTLITLKDNREIRFDVMETFEQEKIEEFMDVNKVSRAMKDSSVTVNFVYINVHKSMGISIDMKEFSGDIYNVFSKLAKATGGIVVSTSKPEKALKKAAKAK